ncbi:hypothetical protein [uncultured Lactobacillus sp.]|uniref:phage upper tail fiber protein n=1 Tax=uncultured Lactobacillus sp. TaxID=153152 RepID=UPI0025FB43C7|nr:hypothetical protein [uncultured Lactobacillus sp.]
MQKFGKTLITNAGRQMLTDVDGAKGKLTYTKASLYMQDVKTLKEADIIALTGLTGPQLATDLQVTDVKDNTVTVLASFNNAQVTQDLTFNSIGWFAKTSVDDKEQLMAITPSETEQTLVAGSNGASTSSIDVEMVFARSHDTTVVLNPSSVGFVSPAQMDGAIKQAKETIENDFQISLKKVNTLGNPIPVSSDTNPDSLCEPGIYYSENGFNFGSKAPADYWQGKSYLIVFHGDRPDRSYNYFQQFLFQSTKNTYNVWCRGGYQYYTDSYYTWAFQNLKDIYGKLKQISINGGKPIDPDDNGLVNLDIPKTDLSGLETKADAKSAHDALAASITSARNSLSSDIKATHDSLSTDIKTARDGLSADIAKRVLTVNDITPDKDGKVVLPDFNHPTKIFKDAKVDPNTITTTGIYELKNSDLQINLDSLPGFTQTNATYGYILVVNNAALDNTFQVIICRQMHDFILDYRYINKTYNDYPKFNRVINTQDLSNVQNQMTEIKQSMMKSWTGTLTQYQALTSYDPMTIYFIISDYEVVVK